MKCPACGSKLVDIQTHGEDIAHLLCVGCGKEFSTVPDDEEADEVAAEDISIPAHLL